MAAPLRPESFDKLGCKRLNALTLVLLDLIAYIVRNYRTTNSNAYGYSKCQ